MARTYKQRIEAAKPPGLTPEQDRANKCQQSKARNETRLSALRTAAFLRQHEWDQLTPIEKLRILDERLGVGRGAVKQRNRIQAALTA